MVLKKKTVIIATLVLLIVAAVYISSKYGKVIKVDTGEEKQTEISNKTDATTTDVQVATGYFVEVKLGKENQRTVEKQEYQEVIDSANTSKEAKTKAENQLLNLIKLSENEMRIEALIKAKGFDDALVLLSDTSANVTVKAKELSADKVNMIKNIVCKDINLPATKVTVQNKE